MRRVKYHNKKTTVNGITFDSRKEAERYIELTLEQRAGNISCLKLQVPFTLIPSQKAPSGTMRPVKYIADFVYQENGETVVEDVKGYQTPEYRIKKKLMYERYGIEIRER